MNFENAENLAPETKRETVWLAALRRNSESQAAHLRNELPMVLGLLAAEVPGAVLELGVHAGQDGMVAISVAVEGGAATAELLSEARAALESVAELDAVPDVVDDAPVTEWPVVTATVNAALGFTAGSSAPAGGGSSMWTQPAHTGSAQGLVELVSPHPGHGLRIRLRAANSDMSGRQLWDAQLAILTDGRPPSLRLRGGLRSMLPGLQIAATPDCGPVVLRVGAKELATVFAVPVAGEQPVGGTYTGAAAPIPVHPTRTSHLQEGAVIRIGSAQTTAGRLVPVHLGLQERLRHLHVLGRTGTGKSSLLAAIAHAVAGTGDGMMVLDPHGHLVDRIIAELPPEAADRVCVIRCGDIDNPVALNPLAVTDPARRDIAIDDVCSIFEYVFDKNNTGIVGPRFRERVAMGLRALAAVHGPRASLLDVPAALADDTFMRHAVATSGDDRLTAWYKNDVASRRSTDHGEVVSWVNSKFEAFASTAAMRAILGSGADALDLTGAMDAGRIVLVDLSKSNLGESATRLLGYLYLNRAWAAALRRSDTARPFTVVVDEAQTVISGSLTNMLSEGRKFGLSVTVAHQYLGQLDEDLLPAVDGNVATTIAFRCAVSDAAAIYSRFGARVDPTVLMTLPDLSAITLRTAAGGASQPHTLLVDHNSRTHARTGDELHQFATTLTINTHRDLVDPYRDLTAAAATGTSNLSTIASATPSPASRPSALSSRPTPGPPAGRKSTFLDEWLARRPETAAPAPAEKLEPPRGRALEDVDRTG